MVTKPETIITERVLPTLTKYDTKQRSKRFTRFLKDEPLIRIAISLVVWFASAVALFPVLHVIAKSLSSTNAVIAGKVNIVPVDFQIETYWYVLTKLNYLQSLFNSIVITTTGTVLGVIISLLTAYPLSRPNLRHRKFFTIFVLFTMLFSAGFVPDYLLMRSLGLLNNLWSVIIPFLIIPFYILLVKNFLQCIPDSLIEASKMDGASEFRILLQVVVPISTPIIATISVYFTVLYWNNYTNAMIFITDKDLYPLPLFLYDLVRVSSDPASLPADAVINLSTEVVSATAVVLSVIPILIVFPVLQRFFRSGIMSGGIKG